MKITICGSIAFYNKMLEAKEDLEKLGHEVDLPPTMIPTGNGEFITVEKYYEIRSAADPMDPQNAWIYESKTKAILSHFDKVAWSDCVLVTNEEKNGIAGYIGPNTLIEMGLALYLRKPIYLTHDLPSVNYTEEIKGMKPIVIGKDYLKIN